MDAGDRQQDQEGRIINHSFSRKPSNSVGRRLANLGQRALEKIGRKGLPPLAETLNQWQQRVQVRTRNLTIMTILGLVLLYAVGLLISIFI